jgi:hypothetical protein
MKQVSTNRRRLIDACRDERQAFCEQFPTCMVPGCTIATNDIHEVARGAHREGGYESRCTWLALCRFPHHEEFDDYAKWPLARQYALKALVDPEYYCRVTLNRIRGRADDAISFDEVAKYFREFPVVRGAAPGIGGNFERVSCGILPTWIDGALEIVQWPMK